MEMKKLYAEGVRLIRPYRQTDMKRSRERRSRGKAELVNSRWWNQDTLPSDMASAAWILNR